MFNALFPGWENPGTLAALVGLRVLCNGSLATLLAGSLGPRHPLTTTVTGLTAFSAVLTVLLLRPGGPGLYASYVELAAQFLLFVSACAGLYVQPSARRMALGVALVACAVAASLVMVPVYGEAFVAP